MSNDLTKKPSIEVDGFAGYSDEVVGSDGDDRVSRSVILGTRIKFIDAKWVTTDGTVVPSDLPLVAMNIKRIVNKWGRDTEKGPLESRELEPGEPYPDFKALNTKVPQKQWVRGFDGELRGPFMGQRVVYFLNTDTMEKYTWIDNLTVGGSIAMSDLVDQTQLMRKLRRANGILPKVTLSDIYMHTKYGGRQRPHFKVVDWIVIGGSEPTPITGPSGGQLPPADAAVKVTSVKKPSAKEITDDEIRY